MYQTPRHCTAQGVSKIKGQIATLGSRVPWGMGSTAHQNLFRVPFRLPRPVCAGSPEQTQAELLEQAAAVLAQVHQDLHGHRSIEIVILLHTCQLLSTSAAGAVLCRECAGMT